MELLLGVFEIQEAKRIQASLAHKEVQTRINFNDQTCTQGCKITVELWSDEKNQEIIANFFHQENARDLAGHDINIEQINSVFDPSAEVVTCQACGEGFSPDKSICPKCGLCY